MVLDILHEPIDIQ
ncbi:unnamed protein product [Pieris macdunnoughi]|uniref:Uncharacterized protein n=1 Tax=Pieris macdunnoughi TaxID=345717 RepID=A0A821W7N1_9NEOP|nr:unnamed protein product [Pieris macdunnoughi]